MATSQGQGKIPVRYDFSPGHVLARKYQVLSHVGSGKSGELYMLTERATGIERTAKFFYPHLDPANRTATRYALKLHRLRHCDVLLPYRTQETISLGGRDVTFLVADFVHGEPLPELIDRQVGGRLPPFEALHLLSALAAGLEKVHAAGEFHGELRSENILVRRRGLGFQVKFIDLCPDHKAFAVDAQDDVRDLLGIFDDAIGGSRAVARAPKAMRAACSALRSARKQNRFRNAGDLRRHLEALAWG